MFATFWETFCSTARQTAGQTDKTKRSNIKDVNNKGRKRPHLIESWFKIHAAVILKTLIMIWKTVFKILRWKLKSRISYIKKIKDN